MTRWQKTLAISVGEIGLLLLVHRVLLEVLAGGDLVSHIFAGGQNASRGEMALVLVFLLVRLMAVLALPGMILCRLGLIWLEMNTEQQKEANTHE